MSDLSHQKYFQLTVYRPRTDCIGYFPFKKTHGPNIISLLWVTISVVSVPAVFWKSQLTYRMVDRSHSQEKWWSSGLASIHRTTGLLNPHNMEVARPGPNHKGQRPPGRSRVIHWLLLEQGEGQVHNQPDHFGKSKYLSVLIPAQTRDTDTRTGWKRHLSPPVFLSHLENSNRYYFKKLKGLTK